MVARGGWPRSAAWLHHDARSGFEVALFGEHADGVRVEGRVAACEDGVPWVVDYEIVVDAGLCTRSATVTTRDASGTCTTVLRADGRGSWTVDGAPAERLDGCLDVDLEASAFTNALPMRRLGLDVGQQADTPAAYVRVRDVTTERLHQRYTRVPDDGGGRRYRYEAPVFDFTCEIAYDECGLVTHYPGIARRAG